MTHDLYRPPARQAVTAGLDEHGQLSAWTIHIVSPSITSRYDPTNKDPFDSVIEYVQNFPYAVPNFDLRYTRQEIGIDVGYWRSVSHTPNCFAIESSIDEIAALVSRDPIEFRRELLAGKPRHLQVLKVVAERSGWGHAPKGHFRGIAYGLSAALWGNVTLRSGRVQQRNFNDHRVLRIHEFPVLDVHVITSEA